MKDTFQKVWGLFTVSERRAFLYVMVVMFIGMTLEMLGVGIILPVIALLTGEGEAASSPIITKFRSLFSEAEFGMIVAGGLVVLFLAKNLFLGYQVWLQQRFILGIQEKLSFRLFEKYLYLTYAFHLKRNSAQLIRNTVNEVAQYVFNVVSPIMVVLTEIIVVMGLLMLLLIVEPIGTLAIGGLIFTVGLIYYLITHRRSIQYGADRVLHEGLRIQLIQQGLGGIKEVQLTGSEENCLTEYQVHNSLAARATRIQGVLTQLPRLILEVVGVSAFAVLLGVMAFQERSFVSAIPTLGVLAAAAFRLIPSANRIVTALSVLRYGSAVVETLAAEIHIPDPEVSIKEAEDAAPLSFSDQVEVRGLSFTYENTSESVLKDLSFSIQRNTSFGIIGKSGSGKSTLIDVLLGLLEPESGGIYVDGAPIAENRRSWQSQIGYVPQTIYLSDESLRKNVAFGISEDRIDDSRIREVLTAAHLDDLLSDLPDGLDTFLGERGVRISGGQRQRIGIARALYRDPQVLVFDEATSSLDNESEERVMEAIRDLQGSRTVIIVAHRLSTIEHCDHLIQLEKGRIIRSGPVSENLPAVTAR